MESHLRTLGISVSGLLGGSVAEDVVNRPAEKLPISSIEVPKSLSCSSRVHCRAARGTLPFAHSDSSHSRRNASQSDFVPQSVCVGKPPGAVSILLLLLVTTSCPRSCRLVGSSERQP